MPNEKINIVGTNIAEKATMIWNVADMLQGYKTSKGAIQLPNDRELPLALVADIARWSFEQNAR